MSFIFSNMEFLERTCLQDVFSPVSHFHWSFSPFVGTVCVDIPGFFKFPQYGKVSPSSQTLLLRQASSFSPYASHSWIILDLFIKLFITLSSILSPSLPVALKGCLVPACSGSRIQKPAVQLKPRPVPLGLCVARMGSVMPLPSGPRPIPGLQPMFCNMRLPMLVSGIGGAFSPTNPEGAVEPRGAAFRLRLTSPVHREPRCPLVCLLAVFTEQLLRCPLSDLESQCNCPCSLLEPGLNQGSWESWLCLPSLSLKL